MGQYASKRDSAAVFKGTQFIAPAVFMGSGLIIHIAGHDWADVGVRDAVQKMRGDSPELKFDDYIQYLPWVVDLGLGLTGVPAKHNFVDRTIEAGVAFISLTVVSRIMKETINSPRPGNRDNKSFPSGHSTTAFAGAELMRMEYGNAWGAGGYAVAATVGFMRVYNDWHWLSDVLFGAGLGILCAHIGEWLLQPIKDLFHIPDMSKTGLAMVTTVDPLSGTPCAGLAYVF